MATIITRERKYEVRVNRIEIDHKLTATVQWVKVDELGRSQDNDRETRETADQPPEVVAAIAVIAAWAESISAPAATQRQADEDAKIAAALAAKEAPIEGGK
jgi:hypothetical protein